MKLRLVVWLFKRCVKLKASIEHEWSCRICGKPMRAGFTNDCTGISDEEEDPNAD